MPTWLKNLVTARAALIAFVLAGLSLLTTFGIILPAGTPDAVAKFIDAGLVFTGMLFGGSALHNALPPAMIKTAKHAALGSSLVILFVALFYFEVLFVACASWQGSPQQTITCDVDTTVAPVLADLCPEPITPVCTAALSALYVEFCQNAATQPDATQAKARQAGLDGVRAYSARLKEANVKFAPSNQ